MKTVYCHIEDSPVHINWVDKDHVVVMDEKVDFTVPATPEEAVAQMALPPLVEVEYVPAPSTVGGDA